jgi:hypothetical protein
METILIKIESFTCSRRNISRGEQVRDLILIRLRLKPKSWICKTNANPLDKCQSSRQMSILPTNANFLYKCQYFRQMLILPTNSHPPDKWQSSRKIPILRIDICRDNWNLSGGLTFVGRIGICWGGLTFDE